VGDRVDAQLLGNAWTCGSSVSTVPGSLEKDTCRDYVVPLLGVGGWQDHFVEQYRVTDGKIVPVPQRPRRRRDQKRNETSAEAESRRSARSRQSGPPRSVSM